MSYLGNTPTKGQVVLALEARKSFSFSLWVKDHRRRAVDLTGCTLRFVMKSLPLDATDVTDDTNLVANDEATLVDAPAGYARFDLQATDLGHTPGEYPFSVVLLTPAGYSAVIVKGVVDLQQNTEFASLASTYAGVNPPAALEVALRGMTTIEVYTGSVIPPGMGYLSDEDKAKLDNLLFGLDLTTEGVPAGAVATADGEGRFTWEPLELPEVAPPDWEATEGPGVILHKPTLGTAAAEDVEAFAPAEHEHDAGAITTGTIDKDRLPAVTALNGIEVVTSLPDTIEDGVLYVKYTP